MPWELDHRMCEDDAKADFDFACKGIFSPDSTPPLSVQGGLVNFQQTTQYPERKPAPHPTPRLASAHADERPGQGGVKGGIHL